MGHKSVHCSSERQDAQIRVVNRLFVTEPRSIREIQRGACVKEVVGSEGRGQKNKGSTVREPENIRLLGSGTKKRVHGEDDKKSDESTTFHPWTMPALFASILARSKKTRALERTECHWLILMKRNERWMDEESNVVTLSIIVATSVKEGFLLVLFPLDQLFSPLISLWNRWDWSILT